MTVLGAGKPKVRILLWWILGKPSSQLAEGCLLATSSRWWKRESSRVSFFSFKGADPIIRALPLMTSSKPNYYLKAPSPNTIILRLELQHVNWGGTHEHSTHNSWLCCFPPKVCGFCSLPRCKPWGLFQALPPEGTSRIFIELLLLTWFALWSPTLGKCRLVMPLCPSLCRSHGGWCGRNHHAQILSVWRHCEHGIQNGK